MHDCFAWVLVHVSAYVTLRVCMCATVCSIPRGCYVRMKYNPYLHNDSSDAMISRMSSVPAGALCQTPSMIIKPRQAVLGGCPSITAAATATASTTSNSSATATAITSKTMRRSKRTAITHTITTALQEASTSTRKGVPEAFRVEV